MTTQHINLIERLIAEQKRADEQARKELEMKKIDAETEIIKEQHKTRREQHKTRRAKISAEAKIIIEREKTKRAFLQVVMVGMAFTVIILNGFHIGGFDINVAELAQFLGSIPLAQK